jgi:hypothetical protein
MVEIVAVSAIATGMADSPREANGAWANAAYPNTAYL